MTIHITTKPKIILDCPHCGCSKVKYINEGKKNLPKTKGISEVVLTARCNKCSMELKK